ncbi:proclotting enzyme-like protein, partial [Dinothrombium tinctorium]
GDSGGPMTVFENDKAYLIGIVSFGSQGMCARKNSGAAYTKISNYTEWIKGYINQVS